MVAIDAVTSSGLWRGEDWNDFRTFEMDSCPETGSY